MSTSTKASIKFALLAYSVYCWVDGSARTRNNLGSSFEVDILDESELSDQDDETAPRGLQAVWEWIQSRGSTMSEAEQSVLGKMDVTVSAVALESYRTPYDLLDSVPSFQRHTTAIISSDPSAPGTSCDFASFEG
jgi:hypothetical protein